VTEKKWKEGIANYILHNFQNSFKHHISESVTHHPHPIPPLSETSFAKIKPFHPISNSLDTNNSFKKGMSGKIPIFQLWINYSVSKSNLK
jgi:hypothetical protein